MRRHQHVGQQSDRGGGPLLIRPTTKEPAVRVEVVGHLGRKVLQLVDRTCDRCDVWKLRNPGRHGSTETAGCRTVGHAHLGRRWANDEPITEASAIERCEQLVELANTTRRWGTQISLRMVSQIGQGPSRGDRLPGGNKASEADSERYRHLPSSKLRGPSWRFEVIGDRLRCAQKVQQVGRVAVKRIIVAVYLEQSRNLIGQSSCLRSGEIISQVEDQSALEAIEEQKDVPDVGARIAPAIREPRQVGSTAAGVNGRVTGPVVHQRALIVRIVPRNLERGIDQARPDTSLVHGRQGSRRRRPPHWGPVYHPP